jgi:hypothetical protein
MELQKQCDELYCLYNDIKNEVRRLNPHLFEKWKAGGFLIDTDIMSMYPHLESVVEYITDDCSDYESS